MKPEIFDAGEWMVGVQL